MTKPYITKLITASAALGFACTASVVSAQTTLISPTINDGGFESVTVGDGKTDFSSGNVPNWLITGLSTTGAAASGGTDQGVDHAGQAFDGASFGFWQPGGASTAFNLVTSGYSIAAGDTLTLTWWAGATGSGGNQAVSIFGQAPGAGDTYGGAATLISVDGTTDTTYDERLATSQNPPVYTEYSLTTTAGAGVAGDNVGITYGDSGSAYTAADDFTLTVTPAAVPEPTTYALMFAGVGGLFMLRRFRSATV